MFTGKATSKKESRSGALTGSQDELPNGQSQLPKVVADYLSTPIPQGSRDRSAYNAAQQLFWNKFPIDEAERLIIPKAMVDGLSRSEAEKCVRQGYSSNPGDPSEGNGVTPHTPYYRRPQPKRTPKFKKIEAEPEELPDYIADGDIALLKAAFDPGELVWMGGTYEAEPGVMSPEFGVVFTVEDWLEQMSKRGEINQVMGDRHGLFVRVDPMRSPTEEECEARSMAKKCR